MSLDVCTQIGTKTCNHTSPDGSTFKALGGTQCLDSFFGWAKKDCFRVRRGYDGALEEHVKEAQWKHWVQGKDHWIEVGKVLKYMENAVA